MSRASKSEQEQSLNNFLDGATAMLRARLEALRVSIDAPSVIRPVHHERIRLVRATTIQESRGATLVCATYSGLVSENENTVFWRLHHYQTADKQSWWIVDGHNQADCRARITTPLNPNGSVHSGSLACLLAHLKLDTVLAVNDVASPPYHDALMMSADEMRLRMADKLVSPTTSVPKAVTIPDDGTPRILRKRAAQV